MRQAKAIAAEQGLWMGVGGDGMAGLVARGMDGAGVVWRGEQKKGVWVGLGGIGAQALAGARVIYFVASDIDKWNGFTSGGVASAGLIGGIGVIGLSQGSVLSMAR